MRNGALLVLVAGAAAVNGLSLERIPAWRQALFALLVLAAYLHGRHLAVRHGWAPLAAVAVPALASGLADPSYAVDSLLCLGIFVTLPWLAGRFRRQQADLVRATTERVDHLERERRFVAERARLLERARIAADMHDALGHELALISLRAGALELAPDMTDGNRSAVAALRASAVAASDLLRHTVTGLRPGPVGGESLRALVDRARDAGMSVHVRGPADPDPGGAVHRVVRESLTNAARHAPGADVDIHVTRTGDTIGVTVSNAVTRPSPRSGAGSGLPGLREHVAAAGGTLEAAAHDGTFTVTACLPASAGPGRPAAGPDLPAAGPGRPAAGPGLPATGPNSVAAGPDSPAAGPDEGC